MHPTHLISRPALCEWVAGRGQPTHNRKGFAVSDPKNTPDLPDFGLSNLAQGAVGLHEWFTSLVEGGFTELQALRFVAEIMAAYSSRNGGAS